MKVVYKISDNIISSLGCTTSENMKSIYHEQCGISARNHIEFGIPEPFHASVVDFEKIKSFLDESFAYSEYTRFEQMVIASIGDAASMANVSLSSRDTLFIISTTKGNVSLLDPDSSEKFDDERVNLWSSGNAICRYFNNPNTPVILSQACISGVSAILTGKMYLESGSFKNVVVTGGDIVSKFIVSGFQSFKALSQRPCKPFDSARDGLSLGEGAATLILGITEEAKLKENSIVIKSGSTSNDANHISGPSRTGEGLFRALKRTLNSNQTEDIAFINAHGTATPYNDEMEAIAISRAGLQNIPVNSLKGYIGHTLGAAGIIETIISSHSLEDSRYIKCLGFSSPGVSEKLNIITGYGSFSGTDCLKLASGFGGCNAVVHLKKYA
jgi:3-oxoacyl-[acyl-carrier-protein] synthase I